MSGSILVVTFDTSTGIRTGRLVGSTLLEDQAVTSGKIASGIVGTVHLRDLNVTSAKLAAAIIGLLGTVTDGAIISSKLASGIVGSVHLADEAVKSGDIGANVIATPHIQNQGILSASIGAGIIGDALLQDFGLLSGKYASGSITEQALVSGISIDIAELTKEPGYRAAAGISSYSPVYAAAISGNYVGMALAQSGSMPAIGLAVVTIASGDLGDINYGGRAAGPTAIISGQFGRQVYVASGGGLGMTPPSASGWSQQIMGAVKDDDEIFLFPEPGYIEIA